MKIKVILHDAYYIIIFKLYKTCIIKKRYVYLLCELIILKIMMKFEGKIKPNFFWVIPFLIGVSI